MALIFHHSMQLRSTNTCCFFNHLLKFVLKNDFAFLVDMLSSIHKQNRKATPADITE